MLFFKRATLPFSVLLLGLLLSFNSSGQFYYKDLWNTTQLNKESFKLKNEGIRHIAIKSFEDDDSPSQGFFCERKIDKDFTNSQMISNSYITGSSITLTFYNDAGQVIKVIDSTSSSVNRTIYQYEKNKLKQITTFTKSDDNNGGISESHQYFYNTNGQVDKMIRRKMDNEYSLTNFSLDKNGNVIEEVEVIKGRPGKKFLYYYDEHNRLTDVVHNSIRANQLLPDYVYEYDNKGNIIKLISTDEGASNYFTWLYNYDDRNLRVTEKCFSKERRLLGSINYIYK
ncbi:MAG: hypothetical protein NVS3B19_08690 [Ginsengibacter sp.]